MTDYLLDFLAVSSCIIKNVIQSVRLRLLDLHYYTHLTTVNHTVSWKRYLLIIGLIYTY